MDKYTGTESTMGKMILCRGRQTDRPLIIEGTGIRLYTAEELCYYIYNNIYLIGQEFVNGRLVEFLAQTGENELCGCGADIDADGLRDGDEIVVPANTSEGRYFISYASSTNSAGKGHLFIAGADDAVLNVTGGSTTAKQKLLWRLRIISALLKV